MQRCPDCGKQMTAHRLPAKSIMLFGHLEIAWWSDAYFCVPCTDERDAESRSRYEEEIYNAGGEAASRWYEEKYGPFG